MFQTSRKNLQFRKIAHAAVATNDNEDVLTDVYEQSNKNNSINKPPRTSHEV